MIALLIIYVGADQVASSAKEKQETLPVVVATVRAAPKKAVANIPATKKAAPKPAAAKKAPVKKAAGKTAGVATKVEITLKEILAALPNLQAGEWQPLADIAKKLHDKKFSQRT